MFDLLGGFKHLDYFPYPLVNIQKTMENHHNSYIYIGIPLIQLVYIYISSKNIYKWAMASIAMLNSHRVIVIYQYYWLVVSNIWIMFHNIWDVILAIDELIFFKMVIAPPIR